MTNVKTRTVAKDELTRVLGVRRRTMDSYIAAGIPCDREAYRSQTAYRFNVAEAHDWIVKHEVALATAGKVVNFSDQRERLNAAQAEKAELQVEVMRGGLVPVDAVERAWTQTFSVVRDLFRAIPMSCVDRLLAAAEDGRPALKAAMQDEIDDALTRASRIEVAIDSGEEADAA